MFQQCLPEADPINFLTRVKIPVLMVNGRYDNSFPVASSKIPSSALLGTPDKDKRHVILDSGHVPLSKDLIRENLDWLDSTWGQSTVNHPPRGGTAWQTDINPGGRFQSV